MDVKRRIRKMETEIIKVDPRTIKLLKTNARYMEANEYERLVENIKRDEKLTSVPFCHIDENGDVEVLSGNHRVMASIDAGLNEIEIMLCKEKLTKDQCLAIQLSHNSITGKDDEEILKQLFKEIETIDFKEYSGLTDDFINFCKETENTFKTPLLTYQNLNLLFLPEELNKIKQVFDFLGNIINNDNVILASMKDYGKYLETTTNISKCLNIKNPSTTFLALIKLANNHLDEFKHLAFENDEIDTIPLSTILCKSDVKKEYAIKIDRTLGKMVDAGIIKKQNKDEGLAMICDYYNKT